jgi:hypothetical protein
VVLGIPACGGVLVALVDQHPLLARALRPKADQREVAAQLLAEQVEVQVACFDGFDRIVGVGQTPCTPVPHGHIAAPILASGDHAFEVEVAERMVFDVDGHPLGCRVERRTLRHGPTEQHGSGLEPQVIVQSTRSVALHHEPVARPSGRPGRLAGTGRFGRDREIALAPIRRQTIRGRRHLLLRCRLH